MAFIKQFGSILISLIGAGAIIVTALLTKGTVHNDTGWLYAFFVWLAAFSAFEWYLARSKDH